MPQRPAHRMYKGRVRRAGDPIAAPRSPDELYGKAKKGMTDKEKQFVEAYLLTLNATQAAINAGYGKPGTTRHTFCVLGNALLEKPEIHAEIQQRLKKRQLTSVDVLAGLERQAKGTLHPFVTPEGSLTITSPEAKDHLDLVKKVKIKRGRDRLGEPREEVELELHDSQSAYVHLGRHHKLFTDTINLEDDKYKEYLETVQNFMRALNPPPPIPKEADPET